MCGIVGIYNFDTDHKVDHLVIKRMADGIIHRGPDDEGYFIKDNLGFGHRRLSIIDIKNGSQPMFNSDESIVIIFNGEVYNYVELREELKTKGFIFYTNSDTEVILKSYECWGINCQERFNGMWAFAIWDKNKNVLFLSRDRIGEKPLFYFYDKNFFAFASEIKSLFAAGIEKKIREELIEWYLFLTNIPEPYTFFKNICKLKAGHYLIVKENSVREYKYWDLSENIESDIITDTRHVYDEFEYLLYDSIKIRMRSDVSFGAFLSGGLDSSTVATIMSELSDVPIETFNMSFPFKDFDESKLAAKVAKKIKSNHHISTVNPDDFDKILAHSVQSFDEPFGDSSSIPTSYISAYAKKRVKMVLTGDGGDEVLSGYRSYQGIKTYEVFIKLPTPLRRVFPYLPLFFNFFLRGRYRYKLNRLIGYLDSLNLNFDERFLRKIPYAPFTMIKAMTNAVKDMIPIEYYLNELMSGCNYNDEFYKMMYIHFKHSLPNDYLVKVDRMSMSHSLETRIPFLDYRLVEFMSKVDKRVKMQGFERKTILKKTFGEKLPQELLNSPKMGFGIPVREWFKLDKLNDQLNALKKFDFGLNNKIISDLLDNNSANKHDFGNFIWSLFNLKKVMENN